MNIIIFSGGLDSTTLLYDIVNQYGNENVIALSFSYGSKHAKQEINAAKITCKKLNVMHQIINLEEAFLDFNSALLDKPSSEKIPEGHYEDENMKKTVVPFRNGILLSMAVGFAESLEARTVFYGAHSGDHAIYPDCREEFLMAMSKAAKVGTYLNVKIRAPYLYYDKIKIVKRAVELGVKFEDTWTCYNPKDNKPCLKCGSCNERLEAFEVNNLKDPLSSQ